MSSVTVDLTITYQWPLGVTYRVVRTGEHLINHPYSLNLSLEKETGISIIVYPRYTLLGNKPLLILSSYTISWFLWFRNSGRAKLGSSVPRSFDLGYSLVLARGWAGLRSSNMAPISCVSLGGDGWKAGFGWDCDHSMEGLSGEPNIWLLGAPRNSISRYRK
jgi:hypothetical protein